MSLLGQLKKLFERPPPPFIARLRKQPAALPEDERAPWAELLDHCETAKAAHAVGAVTAGRRARFDAVGAAPYLR